MENTIESDSPFKNLFIFVDSPIIYRSRNEVAERSTFKVLATQTSGTLNLEGFFCVLSLESKPSGLGIPKLKLWTPTLWTPTR
jgi:hypothetical protein